MALYSILISFPIFLYPTISYIYTVLHELRGKKKFTTNIRIRLNSISKWNCGCRCDWSSILVLLSGFCATNLNHYRCRDKNRHKNRGSQKPPKTSHWNRPAYRPIWTAYDKAGTSSGRTRPTGPRTLCGRCDDNSWGVVSRLRAWTRTGTRRTTRAGRPGPRTWRRAGFRGSEWPTPSGTRGMGWAGRPRHCRVRWNLGDPVRRRRWIWVFGWDPEEREYGWRALGGRALCIPPPENPLKLWALSSWSFLWSVLCLILCVLWRF